MPWKHWSAERLGLALAVLAALGFSFKAIFVKLAYAVPQPVAVDAVTLLALRMAFSLPFFAWMGWRAHRAAGGAGLDRRSLVWVVALGLLGYYGASILDFLGLQYISASLERLILYLNPTIVLLLGWALYGRGIRARQALGMALSYCGVVLVFGMELRGQQGANAAWGAVLVLGSALSYAVYLVYSGEMVKRLGALRLVGLATTVACVLCLLQFALLRPWSAALVAPQVLWLSVLNATLCTAVPVLLVMMAIERIGASAAAQTGMVGPMSTLLMGAWLLDEPFTLWVAAGTALVIAGIFVFTRAPRRV